MTNSVEMEVVFLVADLSGYTALTEAHGGKSAAYFCSFECAKALENSYSLTDPQGSFYFFLIRSSLPQRLIE